MKDDKLREILAFVFDRGNYWDIDNELDYDTVIDSALTQINKEIIEPLENEINEWKYQLAYFTEEDIATPKGVKVFIDKVLDSNQELRERLK